MKFNILIMFLYKTKIFLENIINKDYTIIYFYYNFEFSHYDSVMDIFYEK